MLGRLKAIVKNSSVIYTVYFYLGSLALRFLGLFIPTDKNLALFVSYGGQKYDDSPRFLFEYILKNPDAVPEGLKCVWAFTDPEKHPEVGDKVKIDTLQYYMVALKAGCWITNSSASRGLDFKKKKTRNLKFTHGLNAIKKIGADMEVKKGVHNKQFVEQFDAIFIEGKHETGILVRALQQKEEVFHKTGLPRNDNLIGYDSADAQKVRDSFDIPADKKIILYAPTFRDQNLDANKRNYIELPFDFAKLKKELGNEYVLMIIPHHEVAKYLNQLPQDDFVINAFGYPVLNDLLKASDILISDYSSIVFDYSILERPIFCFGYDYDEYKVQRGVYTELENVFSHGVIRTQDELVDVIRHMDYEEECRFSREQIRDKYLAAYGNAAEKVAAYIWGDR